MNSHFGALLKSARKRRRLSRQNVADMVGISKSYVGELERGQCTPSLLIAARLSITLELCANLMAAKLLRGQP